MIYFFLYISEEYRFIFHGDVVNHLRESDREYVLGGKPVVILLMVSGGTGLVQQKYVYMFYNCRVDLAVSLSSWNTVGAIVPGVSVKVRS